MDWFTSNTAVLAPILAAASGALLVVVGLFWALWLRAGAAARREQASRVVAERHAVDLELSMREQLGRLRMVRELHEVAIHSVSGIISQADGARYAAQSDAGAAARAATTIAETARTALEELRRVMTVVRAGEADAAPQPKLKTARDLFKVMRDAGLTVVFEETGSPFELQKGAELAIYRILQESLSNALKYGGEGTSVTVTFRWTEQGVHVLVDDDGVRAHTRRKGQDPNTIAQQGGYTTDDDVAALTGVATGPGITEMRERTELFGGVFHAYSVPGVGFSIAAVFPAPLVTRELIGRML